MNHIKNNVWKLYVITALRWAIFAMPVIILFFQENGLSMSQILILQAVFSAVVVLSEVPSGYVSDQYGRKLSIILGTICIFTAYLLYALSFGFWGFLAAEIIWGLGASFISGADAALLYDSLAEINQTDKYKKFQGVVSSAENFSEGLAAILGGFLAVISLRTPVYFQAAFALAAIPLAFTLIEPKRHGPDPSGLNPRAIIKTIKFALHDHPQVKWLIIYAAVTGASTLSAVWFYQPYFTIVGLPLALFGIVWAVLQFTTGLTSVYAHKIENFFGRRKTLISLIFLSSLGYVLIGIFQTLWAIAFIFIFYFVRGLSNPVFKDYVNALIPSDTRATILSVKALAGRIIFVVVGPLSGWVSDLYSLQFAFLLGAAIFLPLGVISLLFLEKHRAL